MRNQSRDFNITCQKALEKRNMATAPLIKGKEHSRGRLKLYSSVYRLEMSLQVG